MNLKDLAKYFLHGLTFSILFLILGIGWAFILIILVALGFIIGLIIGLVLLFLIVGFLNSVITAWLWFKEVKSGLGDLLLHGLVLFVVLLIVNGISAIALYLVFPGIAATVISFIVNALADGFAARNVARWWEQRDEGKIPKALEAEWKDKSL